MLQFPRPNSLQLFLATYLTPHTLSCTRMYMNRSGRPCMSHCAISETYLRFLCLSGWPTEVHPAAGHVGASRPRPQCQLHGKETLQSLGTRSLSQALDPSAVGDQKPRVTPSRHPNGCGAAVPVGELWLGRSPEHRAAVHNKQQLAGGPS